MLIGCPKTCLVMYTIFGSSGTSSRRCFAFGRDRSVFSLRRTHVNEGVWGILFPEKKLRR